MEEWRGKGMYCVSLKGCTKEEECDAYDILHLSRFLFRCLVVLGVFSVFADISIYLSALA